MKRRTFIGNMAVAAVAANVKVSMADPLPPIKLPHEELQNAKELVQPPVAVRAAFASLINWMKTNKWLTYLKSVSGVDLDTPEQNWPGLLAQKIALINGLRLEDFAGQKLVEPGHPEFSLLYHVLASPRITPEGVTAYPSPAQLDDLENYIFGSIHYNLTDEDLRENYVVAVFAYEYRPAYKTPDAAPYAGMVYSRTGLGRIGDKEWNYDAISRSYTNKPRPGEDPKHIAVSPARFGVFLARKVPASSAIVYTNEQHDKATMFRWGSRYFLQPIQKIYNGDALTGGGHLLYAESHRNEKLAKLGKINGILPKGTDPKTAPFLKLSASDTTGRHYDGHNTDLVQLFPKGSSLLLASTPARLIREARMPDHNLYSFMVPAGTDAPNKLHSNRRYTSLKLQTRTEIAEDAWDYFYTEGIYKKYKATRFSAPRNAPLFANIRHEVAGVAFHHVDAASGNFEEKVFKGGYPTAFFEDNICDGCVAVTITSGNGPSAAMKMLLDHALPAFSLVSAPDFFPLSDTHDLTDYDKDGNSSFLEGGVENLSYCRLPVNPYIVNPLTQQGAFVDPPKLVPGMQYEQRPNLVAGPLDNLAFDVSDTLLAIVGGIPAPKLVRDDYKANGNYQVPNKRDYHSNTFLSDSAAFFFAPGWDATYSGKDEGGKVPMKFLATIGLGSPFPEDMKLCAAGNGMWPVASPDAARTFMGSLSPIRTGALSFQVTPTAIPLLDQEIGISPFHPVTNETTFKLAPSFGWDGEQGPCMDYFDGAFGVNFTDIGRADYVWNLREGGPGFDMSLLRDLTCTELIARMDALRLCKLKIEGKRPEFSKYWLVSAEKVDNLLALPAIGVPMNFVGQDKSWVRAAQSGISGAGYFYILADTKYDGKNDPPAWVDPLDKRRRLPVKAWYICKIAGPHLTWCKIPPTGYKDASSVTWNDADS